MPTAGPLELLKVAVAAEFVVAEVDFLAGLPAQPLASVLQQKPLGHPIQRPHELLRIGLEGVQRGSPELQQFAGFGRGIRTASQIVPASVKVKPLQFQRGDRSLAALGRGRE